MGQKEMERLRLEFKQQGCSEKNAKQTNKSERQPPVLFLKKKKNRRKSATTITLLQLTMHSGLIACECDQSVNASRTHTSIYTVGRFGYLHEKQKKKKENIEQMQGKQLERKTWMHKKKNISTAFH